MCSLGCSSGPLAPAPVFDAGPAPTRELPHSWVEPVFAPTDNDAARPDGDEPTRDGGPMSMAQDASHEDFEPCTENCTRAAGQLFALRAGRMAFIDDQKLFLQELPDGEPQMLEDLSELAVATLDLDEQHIVYADQEHLEIVVIALENRERRVLPFGGMDGYISGRISIDTPFVSYSLDLPPSSTHAWADEWEVFITDLETETTRVVGPHRLTIQYGPIVRGNVVVFEDDRNGHHNWDLPFFHQYELMSARLDKGDELASLYKRDRENVTLYAFDGRNALIASTIDFNVPSHVLVNVFDKEERALDDVLEPGDIPLHVLGELILVARKPVLAAECYLRLIDLGSGEQIEISEPGQCPVNAQTDGRFVAWSQAGTDYGTYHSFFREL